MYVIYAPTDVANDSDKAAFFNDLHENLSEKQPHALVIMQDPDPTTTSLLHSSNF